MRHFPRFLRRLGLMSMLLPMAACVVHDAEYDALLASAESAPDEQAIVGMWHRRSATLDGVVMNHNLLVKSDHTGLTRATADDPDILLGWLTSTGDARGDLGSFAWTYAGNGLWHLKNSRGRVDDCRISGGKLLRVFRQMGQNHRMIFYRPETYGGSDPGN